MRSSMIEIWRAVGSIWIVIFCLLLIKQERSVESPGRSPQHTEQKKQMKDCSDKATKPAQPQNTCMDVESMCPAQMQPMPGKSFLLPEMWELHEWESVKDSSIWGGVTKLQLNNQIDSGHINTQTAGSTLMN